VIIYYKISKKTTLLKEDFAMNSELFQIIVFFSLLLLVITLGIVASMQLRIYKYKKKIYFIKRDRERCSELLYAAKEGMFCFVYPDQKVKDPQKGIKESCSHRLAVMLNLKNGTATSFGEICGMFYKEDAGILKKYVGLLQKEGKSFEDVLALKNGGRHVCVYGNRVNGADNNLYCDVVWFRDCSHEVEKISSLENERQAVEDARKQLEQMLDSLDVPVWLRDENLQLKAVNRKYLEFVGQTSKEDVLRAGTEISNGKGENISLQLATAAQNSKKVQKKNIHIVRMGKRFDFELREKPYFVGDSLDKTGTVGYLTDNTALEKAKKSFEINQNNHLEVLGVLGTAFAIFDNRANLYFYNASFKNLWNLDVEFLEKTPTYMQFLEIIRDHKMLPPIPDMKNFKEEEMSVFDSLLETKEDLLHLPDGRTIRRLRTPHPNGVIFAFEDVSDRLATMRRLNELTSMQQSILDNLSDSVVIFGANRRLKFYNRAYLKLWGIDIGKMQDEPKLETVLSYQKLFFPDISDWPAFCQSMLANITSGHKFDLTRDDNTGIAVSPAVFYDGSIMITYTVK